MTFGVCLTEMFAIVGSIVLRFHCTTTTTTTLSLPFLPKMYHSSSELLNSIRKPSDQGEEVTFDMNAKEPELRDYTELNPQQDYVDMEDGNRNFPPPPLRELPDIPDEIGFHVSVDVHSHSASPEPDSANAGATFAAENPFSHGYTDAEKQALEDEAMGYLTRATYHQNYREMDEMYYNQEKFDISQSPVHDATEFNDTSGERPLLVTAVSLQPVEAIEGEIIERVDYENVTLTRTKVKSSESSSTSRERSRSSGVDFDQDYLNMDSEGKQIWDQRMPKFKGLLGASHGGEDNLEPPVRQQDAASVKSSVSYENFDPVHQCVPTTELTHKSTDRAVGHKVHDTYEPNGFGETIQEPLVDENSFTRGAHDSHTLNTEAGIEEDFYVNVPTQSQRAEASGIPADTTGSTDQLDYENIALGVYQQSLV